MHDFCFLAEYIHCLHWNVDWWRLHILYVKLCGAKHLVSEQPLFIKAENFLVGAIFSFI